MIELRKLFTFTIIVFILTKCHVAALRCYTCSYVAGSTADRSCVTDPNALVGNKYTTCSKKYCIILRQDLISPSGTVNTFLRGCEDKPLFFNNVIEDSTYKTYYRSCTTDLCNSGDGLRTSGSALGSDAGAGENRIVRGLNGSTKMDISAILLLVTVFMSITFSFVKNLTE